MEITYMVRATDGQDYGPATLEQISGWIREGRISPQQQVRRSDVDYWAAAGDYTELKGLFGAGISSSAAGAPVSTATAVRPTVAAPAKESPAAVAALKSGASWFYWIAGLSLVNSISAASGSDWRFIVGLGITRILDDVGAEMGGSGRIVVLVLDLLVAGAFILFGVFGHKRHLWAFVVGMILFALDGGIFLLGQKWVGVGFHVFVLYCLFRGFNACRELKVTQTV